MRAFIAVELSAEIRQRLGEVQERLRRAPCGVKWVKPELMHITLKFLGETAESAVQDVEDAIALAAEGIAPFDLAVAGLGSFPEHGAPRVIWAGVRDDGSLAQLNARLEEGLAALGFEPERRPFSAHLTIGRAKDPRGAGPLRGPLAREAATRFGSCRVEEVVLMRSDLSPAGPTYTPVRHHRL
ncbi:MAG TPA: RNA 2',3'-cyclic phosphodiesterase [Planctomycetota bacterium]|nr:RNA 2',3'-cyclic phosphodiesterase [Planctomycetota bacterium]HRR81926.1 RNA 2',3'-cyclic phosphodiesterase [Planctomycetota bacterium]HRT94325.1 RNA 2',3'-cyclic phosphodiesterase [Planctomycetota bacterium]